ncbi:MAG: hypothetical protein IJQ39_07055 [Thermoguttaceae bacterium]|nr:hypothetical protein [Thermoguttaceae bacterium]
MEGGNGVHQRRTELRIRRQAKKTSRSVDNKTTQPKPSPGWRLSRTPT